MMRWLRPVLGVLLLLTVMFALVPKAEAAGPTCNGKFVNPITDVCWSCLFPLSVGGLKIWPSSRPDPSNPASPVWGHCTKVTFTYDRRWQACRH